MIRRLWAIERGKVRDHLLRLDPEDRLCRFGGYISDESIEAYCAGLDWNRAVIIGYLVDGEVRGLGELKPAPGQVAGAKAAEAALSVEKPYQNRGVGTELLRRLILIARNRSIRSLHMLCLLENGKVVRLTRKLGAELAFDHGEVAGRLALPWPNHLTLLLELLDDASTVLAVLRPVETVPAPNGTGSHPDGDHSADPPLPLRRNAGAPAEAARMRRTGQGAAPDGDRAQGRR